MGNNEITDYPIDLPGIKKYGLEKWMEDFFPPFDQNKFQEVLDNIFDAYADAMLQFDPTHAVYIAGAINYKMVNLIAVWYYKYLSLVELKRKGITSITGQGDIDQVIKKRLKASPIKNVFKKVGFKQRLKEKAYYARQNMEIHNIFNSALGICKGDCYVIGVPGEGLIKSYLEKKNWTPVCLRALQFFPAEVPELNDNDNRDMQKFFEKFYSNILEDKDFFNSEFKEDFKNLMVSTVAVFNHICEKLKGNDLKTLFVSSIHFTYSRVVAAAWKASGGEVIGLAHGNVYLTGAYGQPVNNGTLLICDKFLVASHGHKIQLEYARKESPCKLVSDVEIVLQDNQSLIKVYEECKSQPKVEKVKKIMMIGYPMDYMYSPYLKGHETMTYTHMIINIMKILKEAGYYIIYKDHPDTVSETEGFFDGYIDKLELRNFTDVYQETDCILYISPYSTTFGFGALTQKTMVYVNHAGWKWHPDIFELLEKRAVSFYVTFDQRGVIQVDKEMLLKNIEESVNCVDHSVVEKYAFGKA